MTALEIPRPNLSYPYEFDINDYEAAWQCCCDHGFAVVKQMIDLDFVERLKQAIWDTSDPDRNLAPGESRTRHAFCDVAPCILELFDNEPWLRLQEHIYGTKELTIHRCASILKNVGAIPVTWHTDWCGYRNHEPRDSNEILNQYERPSGAWFYLNGTHPSRAGLMVIEDSHRIDWECPEGFEFINESRGSFHRVETEPRAYDKPDVPGAIALHTDPGDMILFAARTYHYATAHNGTEARLSCALGLRATSEQCEVPWDLPEEAQQMIANAPVRYQPYLRDYRSYVNWRAEPIEK